MAWTALAIQRRTHWCTPAKRDKPRQVMSWSNHVISWSSRVASNRVKPCQIASSRGKSRQAASSRGKSRRHPKAERSMHACKANATASSSIDGRIRLAPSGVQRSAMPSRVESGQVGSSRVKSGRVGSSRVKSGQVGSSRVESSRVESSRVESGEVG